MLSAKNEGKEEQMELTPLRERAGRGHYASEGKALQTEIQTMRKETKTVQTETKSERTETEVMCMCIKTVRTRGKPYLVPYYRYGIK